MVRGPVRGPCAVIVLRVTDEYKQLFNPPLPVVAQWNQRTWFDSSTFSFCFYIFSLQRVELLLYLVPSSILQLAIYIYYIN